MITGYFYAGTKEKGRTGVQIRKMLVMTVAAFFCYTLVSCLFGGPDILNAYLRMKDPAFCVKVLLFNEPIVTASYWYMPAVLYVLVVVWLADRTIGRMRLYPLIPVLLILNLCFGKYSHLVFGRNFELCCSRNFLFYGLPFLLLGDWLAGCWESWMGKKMPLGIVLGLGLCLSLIEYFWLGSTPEAGTGDMFIGTPFVTVALFLLVVQMKMPVASKADSFLQKAVTEIFRGLATVGHKYGTVIYLSHEALHRGVELVVKKLVPGFYDLYALFSPLVIFVGAIIAGWMFFLVRDRLRTAFGRKKYAG